MGDGVALLIVQPAQQRIDICVIDEGGVRLRCGLGEAQVRKGDTWPSG